MPRIRRVVCPFFGPYWRPIHRREWPNILQNTLSQQWKTSWKHSCCGLFGKCTMQSFHRYDSRTIQERYNEFKTKEVEQRKKDFKKVLEISKKATVRGKNTPLYNHAASIWRRDEKCVYDIAGVINRENCIIHLAVHICWSKFLCFWHGEMFAKSLRSKLLHASTTTFLSSSLTSPSFLKML